MNYKNYLSFRKVTMSSQEQDLENGKKVTTSKVKQFTVFTLSYYSKYYYWKYVQIRYCISM